MVTKDTTPKTGKSSKVTPIAQTPAWLDTLPSAYDIVTCWYPDRLNQGEPGLQLRPGLVIAILRNNKTQEVRVRVAFGTKNLKFATRSDKDVIIQLSSDIDALNLRCATRFDLDYSVDLPWNERFFGCWKGFSSPRLSAFREEHIRLYAYLMLRRRSR